MDVNPFLKRLMKVKKEDVIHSSAYASAQNSCGIGSASTETFTKRMAVEKNRQMIRGYGDSSVANRGFNNGPKAKTYIPASSSHSSVGMAENSINMNRAARPIPPKNPGISR